MSTQNGLCVADLDYNAEQFRDRSVSRGLIPIREIRGLFGIRWRHGGLGLDGGLLAHSQLPAAIA